MIVTTFVLLISMTGFAFTLGPGDPRYQFDVSGVFPNGTTFFISAPVATLPTIVTKGQDVIGNWGEAGFALFSGSSSMVLDYNSPSAGVTGGVTFLRDKTSAHVPGSPNTQGLPYFSSLATGQPLNAAEETLYTESGWVIEMPRASAHVLLNIGGTEFKLNGTGYHDHNWAPVDFGQITYTWVLGLGSCGPYDLGYFEVKAVDSTRDADIVQGSLAYNGKFIQTQAHLYGSKPAVNTVDFQLIGQTVDPVTQQTVPTGVDVTYTLTNGTVYQFNLKNSVTNPALPVYHRWRLTGTGGKVGGQQYKCALIGEWLNPGLAVYKEGENVFADAM
jgi:hypothetical protein